MTFGFSIENPEQQVGSVVVFPSAITSTLTNQYNTGINGLSVPNLTPDFVFKGSFTGKVGHRTMHLDTGGLLRTFRSSNVGDPINSHSTAVGYGGNLNGTFEVVKGLKLLLNGYASHGGGRFMGGLYPDVIVTASGAIQPINSYSWVGGLEFAATKQSSFYGYYGGAYGQRVGWRRSVSIFWIRPLYQRAATVGKRSRSSIERRTESPARPLAR